LYKKILNKSFISIFLVALFQTMAQYISHALVPKYADSLGAAASVIGLISGLYAGTALVLRPVTSPTFDIFNKKDILAVALGITSLSFVVFYLSNSIVWIAVGRIIQGLGIGVAGPIGLSIVASALPRDVYSRGVSLYTVTQAFGQAIGPSIGLSLAKTVGYQKTFLISAVLMAVAVGLTRLCSDTPISEDRHYRVGFKSIFSKAAIPAAILILFNVMPYASTSAMITIYGDLLSIERIGLYFTVYAIGLLVSKAFLGGLADKHGLVKVYVLSLIVYALAFLFLGIARALPMILVAAVFAAVGFGVGQPCIQAMCMKTATPDKTGVAANTLYFFQDIGLFVGPYFSGMVIDMFRSSGSDPVTAYGNSFILLIVPIVIAAVLAILLRNVIKRNIKK